MVQSPVKDLGPCLGYFDTTLLGPSFGNVMFRDEEQGEEVHEDAQGKSAVDEILLGRKVEVEFPLTRATLTQLGVIINESAVAGDIITVSNPIGISLYDAAKELVLKPIVDSVVSTDDTEWITVFKCAPKTVIEFGYGNEGQRVFKVLFKAFPDQTSGVVGRYWKMGTT